METRRRPTVEATSWSSVAYSKGGDVVYHQPDLVRALSLSFLRVSSLGCWLGVHGTMCLGSRNTLIPAHFSLLKNASDQKKLLE